MGEFEHFALVPEQGAVPEMAQLDAATQARIAGMAQKLDVEDAAAVAGFGARTQKEMAACSDIALSQMLRKDVDGLNDAVQTLGEQIRACSFSTQARGLFRRMFGGAASLDEVRAAYEKAEPRINACADEMTDRRVALMRDSALLERLYECNEAVYRELCSLIVVGEEALRQAKARGADAQAVERMARRVQDIRVSQVASTQLAAQIRLIQQSDEVACEKLKTALEVTIPLWKSQMAAALGMARATDALAAQRRIGQEAARGIRAGAQELNRQKDALVREAGAADRARAEETADALLEELTQIEQALRSEKRALARAQTEGGA